MECINTNRNKKTCSTVLTGEGAIFIYPITCQDNLLSDLDLIAHTLHFVDTSKPVHRPEVLLSSDLAVKEMRF